MARIRALVSFKNKQQGGSFRKGKTYTVEDRYAQKLKKNGYAQVLPDDEPAEQFEPSTDTQDRFYVPAEKKNGGWWPVIDRETGEEADTPSTRDREVAIQQANELNQAA